MVLFRLKLCKSCFVMFPVKARALCSVTKQFCWRPFLSACYNNLILVRSSFLSVIYFISCCPLVVNNLLTICFVFKLFTTFIYQHLQSSCICGLRSVPPLHWLQFLIYRGFIRHPICSHCADQKATRLL